MTTIDIERECKVKQEELLEKYFGNLLHEAVIERPETIGEYTPELPFKVEAEYYDFLEKIWKEHTPEGLKGTPMVLEEQKLRELMTADDKEGVKTAYENATRRTLKERIMHCNHKDVTYYKELLLEYTRDLLFVMRQDFLEEITGKHIRNKAFEE